MTITKDKEWLKKAAARYQTSLARLNSARGHLENPDVPDAGSAWTDAFFSIECALKSLLNLTGDDEAEQRHNILGAYKQCRSSFPNLPQLSKPEEQAFIIMKTEQAERRYGGANETSREEAEAMILRAAGILKGTTAEMKKTEYEAIRDLVAKASQIIAVA